MKIYVAHSTKYGYQKELYAPIRNSELNSKHDFVLPHEKSEGLFNSKELFENGCDLVIAEVSLPSIGMGIELGWANMKNIPIICFYKKGSQVSGSLKAVTDKIIEYENEKDFISKLKLALD